MFKITTWPISGYATWIQCKKCGYIFYRDILGWRSRIVPNDICYKCGNNEWNHLVGRWEVTETRLGIFGYRRHKVINFVLGTS